MNSRRYMSGSAQEAARVENSSTVLLLPVSCPSSMTAAQAMAKPRMSGELKEIRIFFFIAFSPLPVTVFIRIIQKAL